MWEPLALFPHTQATTCLFPIESTGPAAHHNTHLFDKLCHVPAILSKIMPTILPCASGHLQAMCGSTRKLLADGMVYWPWCSRKQMPRWDSVHKDFIRIHGSVR